MIPRWCFIKLIIWHQSFSRWMSTYHIGKNLIKKSRTSSFYGAMLRDRPWVGCWFFTGLTSGHPPNPRVSSGGAPQAFHSKVGQFLSGACWCTGINPSFGTFAHLFIWIRIRHLGIFLGVIESLMCKFRPKKCASRFGSEALSWHLGPDIGAN